MLIALVSASGCSARGSTVAEGPSSSSDSSAVSLARYATAGIADRLIGPILPRPASDTRRHEGTFQFAAILSVDSEEAVEHVSDRLKARSFSNQCSSLAFCLWEGSLNNRAVTLVVEVVQRGSQLTLADGRDVDISQKSDVLVFTVAQP
jgi:hypothetical protein